MHYIGLIAAVLGLLSGGPAAAELQERSYLATCSRDNLYRSFIDSRYSASASAFCSTYVRSTLTATETVTVTPTSTPLPKRDLPATTVFAPSKLRSACSCILTATPAPTTLFAATKTVTAAPPACTDAKPIVPNGDFETGALAPWLVLFSAPNLLDRGQYFSYNVTSPGYNSQYAFTVTDNSAAAFVEVDIGQIAIPVCVGRKYKISARVFITSSIASKEERTQLLLQLYAGQALVAQAPEAYVQAGPNRVWRALEGTFTAREETVAVQVTFRSTVLGDVRWGVDDVVVSPF